MISMRIAMPRKDDALTVAARALVGAKDKHVPGAAARARRTIEAHIDAVLKIVIDAALDGSCPWSGRRRSNSRCRWLAMRPLRPRL
jgi:hypothetical protein